MLELVPGETLAERIAHGPIPVDEAVRIAKKIAEALDEAHEHGIVHRDLKPANVKITPDDEVKVLDFGLAKAFAADHDTPEAASSMSPTIARDATRAGVIMGTAAYMSPEQAIVIGSAEGGLSIVAVNGGIPEPLTAADKGKGHYLFSGATERERGLVHELDGLLRAGSASGTLRFRKRRVPRSLRWSFPQICGGTHPVRAI